VVAPVITTPVTPASPVGSYATAVTGLIGPAAADYTPTQSGGGETVTPATLTATPVNVTQSVG